MSNIEIGEFENYELAEGTTPDWKPKVLVAGAIIGAAVGLAASYLFIKNVEDETQPPEITAGKGLKIGLLLLSLVRNVADLA